MATLAAVILYLIAVVLGTWSASLFWRAWHAWRLERRARRKDQAPVKVLTRKQRRFGVIVGIVCLPVAGFAFSYGELVRGDVDGDQELTTILARAAMAICFFLAAGAVYVAFRFDPSQGRRRCGRCWYDMSATSGRKCPECGHEPQEEKGLFRTRRAPRLIIVALLLLCLGYGVWVTPQVAQRGAVAAVPTTLLIAAFPWLPERSISSGPASLGARVGNEELWGWQERFLQWRVRRVVRHTGDLTVLRNAGEYIQWRGEVDPTLVMSARAQLAFVRESCDPNGPAPAPRARAGPDYRLTSFMPAEVDPSIVEEAERCIRAALRGSSDGAKVGAAYWAPYLGAASARLVPELEACIRDADAASGVRALCVFGLRTAASNDPEAWRVLVDATRSDDAGVRTMAMRVMSIPTVQRDEAREFGRAGMSDPDNSVAAAATYLYMQCHPSKCDALDELGPRVKARPWLGVQVIEELARGCPDDRVVEMIDAMLASNVGMVVESGCRGADLVGARGKPLLPRLRQLTTAQPNSMTHWYAQAAVDSIERAAGEGNWAPAPEPSAHDPE